MSQSGLKHWYPFAIRHGGGGFKNLTALDLGEHKREVGGPSVRRAKHREVKRI